MTAIELTKVQVVVKESTDPEGAILRRVQSFFEEQGLEVKVRTMDFHDEGPKLRIPDWSPDLIIVIGGDGTFLRTARSFAVDRIPMVGINRGHLGFLTSIETQLLETSLQRLMQGDYKLEKRLLLRIDEPAVTRNHALNDVVLKGMNPSQLIRLDLWLSDQLVAQLDADGLIVSTPTGSTAYNMAAGGPVMSPKIEGFCVTPICPHSFAAKPLIVPAATRIRVVSAEDNGNDVQVSADGQTLTQLKPGEAIVLGKASFGLPWISFETDKEVGFYQLLREKLGWAENPRQVVANRRESAIPARTFT